jgi:hypothetical protein
MNSAGNTMNHSGFFWCHKYALITRKASPASSCIKTKALGCITGSDIRTMLLLLFIDAWLTHDFPWLGM